MSADFFRTKRSWSKYKDSILGYYLTPYIPKVARLRKPILIVDCFAGCGRFGDGEPGSPLIICDEIKRWRESQGISVTGLFIEAIPRNFKSLETALKPHQEFATAQLGKFEDHIEELASRAQSETIFLYIAPYTVRSLIFNRMKTVYDQIEEAGASVEVLMNFNVATFMRWALAALTRVEDFPFDDKSDEYDFQADDPKEQVELATLNGIAGGDYWKEIACDESLSFAGKLDEFTDQYARRMRSSFNYVCTYPVKEKYEHQTPKYMLVYATRHPDGLELMNDAMCDARQQFLGAEFAKGRLFEVTPDDELLDLSNLKTTILRIAKDTGTRKQIRHQALVAVFCRYAQKDLNRAVTELLKSGKLHSSTGKTRINDDVKLSTQPFD